MSELKPCPFCGGKYVQVRYIGGEWQEPSAFVSGYRGECCSCYAITAAYGTEAEAAAAWNTRHVETCRLPETYIDHGSIEYNGTTSWRLCSACGAEVLADPANYCPNCGRKVEG